MISLFSVKQVRDADSFAKNDLKMPSLLLMENAARSIFERTLKHIPDLSKSSFIGIMCGRGNNAGDGFALARHFILNGYNVIILYTCPPEELSPDAKTNFELLMNLYNSGFSFILKKYETIGDLNVFISANLLFDALLGTGAKGNLRSPYCDIVRESNKFDCIRIAIDIPSGLDADTGFASDAFNADITVTLGEYKRGLFVGSGPIHCGRIVKGNIGIGDAYFTKNTVEEQIIELDDAVKGLPFKKKDIHKYSSGKLYLIAGSVKLPGAGLLTARAAFKSGAGAVVLGFPDSVRTIAQDRLSEIIVEGYEDNGAGSFSGASLNTLLTRLDWCNVIAMGPGLGRTEETVGAVRKAISMCEGKRCVLDADALFAIGARLYKNFDLRGMVLTPHYGEFSHLLNLSVEEIKKDVFSAGREFVRDTGAYLILKGAPTIIFTPSGKCFVNGAGNQGMAKYGTGDALTGIIAGFLAQQKNITDALISSVYFHSYSADLLKDEHSVYSITAEMIIDNFGRGIAKALK